MVKGYPFSSRMWKSMMTNEHEKKEEDNAKTELEEVWSDSNHS